jgi:hypothetical protein
MLTFLESFCEACADGDICTPVSLHYAVLVFALLPSLGKFPRLESFYEACADEDIYTPLFLHTGIFALCGTSFCFITQLR